MLIVANQRQVRLAYKILLHYWKDPEKESFFQTEDEYEDLARLIEDFMAVWHLPQPERLAVSIRRFKRAKEILRERKRELTRKGKRIVREYLRNLYKEKPDIIKGF
jgi:hypothetical protein